MNVNVNGAVRRLLRPDPEVHRLLIEKVFPSQAEVTTVEEWARKAG
ncbi:hypothetical protein [Streptomyces asiaticus]